MLHDRTASRSTLNGVAAPFAPVRPPSDDHGLVRVVDAPAPGDGRHRPGSPRRTTLRVLGTIGVAAIVVGGLTVLSGLAEDTERADDARGTGPAPATDVPESSMAAVPADASPASTEPTPDPPAVAVDTAEPAAAVDVAQQLAEIETERQAVLATIERVSFTATVTSSFTGQPDSTQRHDVIVHADGSLWATDPDGGWQSFDPRDGTVRGAWVDDTGSLQFQELSGQTSNHLPLASGMGVSPPWAGIALAPDADFTIDEVVVDGRPAWLVASRSASLPIPPTTASGAQLDTWTIDQGTGFVVASSTTSDLLGPDGAISGRSVTTTTLDDLTVGTPLPIVFPGSFPGGAEVVRSGAPSPVPADVIPVAQAGFGDEFFLPAVEPTTTIISFMGDGTSQPWFEATWTNGFASPTMLRFATMTGTEGDASCPDCTGSMLDELRSAAATAPQTIVRRHGIWINFAGPDDDAIRELIASIP